MARMEFRVPYNLSGKNMNQASLLLQGSEKSIPCGMEMKRR